MITSKKATSVALLFLLATFVVFGLVPASAQAPTVTKIATTASANTQLTATATFTPTATLTKAVVPSLTTTKPVATATSTVIPATATLAKTVMPSLTATKAAATQTVTPSATVSRTQVAPTATVTRTLTPSATATKLTLTPTKAATATPTKTYTLIPTPTLTRAALPRSPLEYDSGQSTKIYAMNVGTAAADIAIQYYDSNGNPVSSDPICNSVPVNGRCIFDGSALTSPFKGSGVISSTQAVAAIARIVGSTYGTMADYTGKTQSEGDTSLFLPSVHRSSWQTVISAQNMGSATTQIDITIRNTAGAIVASASKANVQPGTSAYFDLANDAAFSGLGSSFAGSAILNGNGQPLAAVVMENNTQHGGKFAYEGFTTAEGGSTLYFPVLHRNRAPDYAGTGWNSSSFIQNMDTTNPVTVRVTWVDEGAAGGGVAKQANYTIPAGSSLYLTTYYEPSTRNNWAGSMTVAVISGTGPIVGISSEVYQNGGTADSPLISAYAEYRAVKSGNLTLYSPVAEGHYNGSANVGDYARHFVQNLSSSQTAQVRGEWINPTSGVTLHSETVDIPPGSSWYFAPNKQPSGSGMWNFSGTFKATSLNGVSIAGLTYDSTLGSSPGEPGYRRDTTGMFNMPGQ
jgi:hypothetical protein